MPRDMLRWLICFMVLVNTRADVHVGGALNIFSHFGNLGAVIKVNPHNTASRFFDHESVDVFEEVLETRSSPYTFENPKFNGHFRMQLCDNLEHLQQVYFRSYYIEGIEKPWKALAGGWTSAVLARHLGLNSTFVAGDYGYGLVRLSRVYELVRLTPHMGLRLNNWTAERTELVIPGQVGSVLAFIQQSGSHYVNSYTTGNSLYQVYAFTPVVYKELKIEMHYYEVRKVRLGRVLSFFSPWRAEYVGLIRSSSGNSSLEQWASNYLFSRFIMFSYPNLLKLYVRPDLLQELNYRLGNDALLSVDMRSLAPLIRDSGKRHWFQEVLDNHLKLWELNV
ncbi:hypothetical protein J6590_076047 [Homalodisca vitripennis]|nr:hypothetical protein J6590_076047 [Homalodisca vitripennis]